MGCAPSRTRCFLPRSVTYACGMKAIQIEEFGGPENLKLVELPDPEPGDGTVVVDVNRCGINWADTHAIRNDYLAEQELPLVPGAEIAGTTGDGRRVAALVNNGGYAQKALVPEAFLVPLPDEVSDEQAARSEEHTSELQSLRHL